MASGAAFAAPDTSVGNAAPEQPVDSKPAVPVDQPKNDSDSSKTGNAGKQKDQTSPKPKETSKSKKILAKPAKEFSKNLKNLGFGVGVFVPQTRPAALFLFDVAVRQWSFGTRLSASYISLSSVFDQAAQKSDYADKIKISFASLADMSLHLPEVGYMFPLPFFVSASPLVRANLINANFKTTAGEPLKFLGIALTAGAAASGGYRFKLSSALSIDLVAEIQFRLWDAGYTNVAFEQDNTTAVPSFTESELEHIVDSLQPYVQSIAKRNTAGGGLRLIYSF